MRNKSIVRLATTFILIVTLIGTFTIPAFAADSATKSYIEGDYTYDAYMSKTSNSYFSNPITDTQVYHTKGIETTIGITKGYTKTWTGEGSFTTGYNGVFLELAGSLGVSQAASHSISVTVSYKIPEAKESGYYRIEQRCPKYTVRELLSDISDNGTKTILNRNLKNMPGKNAAYYVIVKYK